MTGQLMSNNFHLLILSLHFTYMKPFKIMSILIVGLMLVGTNVSHAASSVNMVGLNESCGGDTMIPRTCSPELICSYTNDAPLDVPGICVEKLNPYAVDIT